MIALIVNFALGAAIAQTDAPANTISDVKKRDNISLSAMNDGVYYSFDDVKKNHPSLTKSQLVKSSDDDATFSFSQWSTSENLFYLDESSIKRRIDRSHLWGYVEDGTPFIYLNGKFHKFTTIGSIGVFIESYPLAPTLAPVLTEVHSGTYQRLFDFKTGQIADYDVDNLISLFQQKDPGLFNDFASIKTLKAKRKKMYKYIERYNEKYELFK